MKKKRVLNPNKPSCPVCGSRQILTNIDGKRTCRVCGERWQK